MILKVKNDLFDYPNRYIMQIKDGFKFSLDSLLLAEFTKLRQSDKLILDMCTGNAPVPLVLSLKTDAKIIGFELQRAIAGLAWESISINGLDKQITVINSRLRFSYRAVRPSGSSQRASQDVPKSFRRQRS